MTSTRTTLRARSPKMRRLMVERYRLVARLLAERPACEAALPGCTGHSTDCHELLSRARGGSILNPANIACLCATCHHKVTIHAPGTEQWRHSRQGGAA